MHVIRSLRRLFLCAPLAIAAVALGDPPARRLEIDFARQVTARNLSGLASRSDGRLVPGPVGRSIEATLPELVWCLEPDGANGWLVGGGADGRVVRITLDGETAKVVDAIDLEETNVFAVCATGPGEFLAGAAPGGVLYLVKDGAVVSRAPVGAEVIWDIRHLEGDDYLVATGSPATIQRVTLGKFRDAGIAAVAAEPETAAAVKDAKPTETPGIAPWATIRDRNVRRLIVAENNRVIAGSSPRGAVYEFGKDGGKPFILNESKDAEVADLLVAPDGKLYAALVYNAPALPDRRSGPRTPPAVASETANAPIDFSGRSEILRFGKDRLPETVVARNGVAFYKLAAFGNTLLIGAGERGEILGYDDVRRALITYSGAQSSQVNGIAALVGRSGQFLILRNNFSGLGVLDFSPVAERTAETSRLEFGQPSRIGLLQFSRLREIDAAALSVDFKIGNSADEGEGWTDWQAATREGDAYRLGDSAARFARIRLRVPADVSTSMEISRASLFHMAQNRAPAVQDFRVFPPGLGLIPMPDPPEPASLPLGQFLFPNQPPSGADGPPQAAQKNAFLASQVVSQPGNQLVYWNAVDADGDNLLATLSLRAVSATEWTEVAAGVYSNHVGFSTADLAEGHYILKLTVVETAPRPESERQKVDYESDDLTVDRSPPEILSTEVTSSPATINIRVSASDKWSLIRGARAVLNNGTEVETILPLDGILDGRTESFDIEIPRAAATGATNAEVMVVDQAGNRTSQRVVITP
ncbi:MAG TPA: hypothetical protein VMM36_12645 [Opitutaceae bacterium]|nr:hypothetical protein [Opitutaceae bacterium]